MQASEEASKTVTQLLLLLVQQLQGAPSQVRAAFLGSPAGTILLQLLRGISTSVTQYPGELLLQDAPGTAAGHDAGEAAAAAGWSSHLLWSTDLVEVLLLPGLLLERVPLGMSAVAAPHSSSSTTITTSGSHGSKDLPDRSPADESSRSCPATMASGAPDPASPRLVVVARGKPTRRIMLTMRLCVLLHIVQLGSPSAMLKPCLLS
jgi:hypothetical protein